MNSLILKPDIFNWKNFILPKLWYVCIFRLVDEVGMAQGGEGLDGKEQGVMELVEARGRSGRKGARLHGGVHHEETAGIHQFLVVASVGATT